MKHKESIDLLNKAIADELFAVHQYMYFHFHCDDQGYDLISSLFKQTAIMEMIHVEKLADRILFLKGEVEMVASAEVEKTHDVKAMLEKAAKMEEESARDYNLWAIECAKNADSVTKTVFEELVVDEEDHFAKYDAELDNLQKFGENYLVLQSMERSKKTSMPPQN